MATKVKTLPKVVLGLVAFAALFFGIQYMRNKGVIPTQIPTGTAGTVFGGSASTADSSSPLGSASNPLKIGINSFHGWGPGLVANGSSLTTKPGSIYANKGVNVEFVIQDTYPDLTTILTAKTAHCSWRTSDSWAQEQPNLRSNGLDAKGIMIADNTRGADAIVARDPNIKSVEDLAGRKVSLLKGTPSHGLFIYALNSSSLSGRKKASIDLVLANPDEGTGGILGALNAGHVDAAVFWDPDLTLALKAGAHVVYSTKDATNLIFDMIVCDTKLVSNPANESAFQNFVAGWMEGVDQVNANKNLAVDAIVNTMDFYKQFAHDHGRPTVLGLYNNLLLTNLAENVRILGLAEGGTTNHYGRVYADFDAIYRGLGTLANPHSPVVDQTESFDYRFIRNLMAAQPSAKAAALRPQASFSAAEARQAENRTAMVTKPVTVNFATNESLLSAKAKDTLDHQVAPMVETYSDSYFEISGNTDSTGSVGVNQRVSLARAQAVVDYLVAQWEFPRERFIVKGNGSSFPLCDEKAPGNEGLSLDDCRAANRTTRVAVKAN
jgi:NitT/TauT family transport system substrate-binding protein